MLSVGIFGRNLFEQSEGRYGSIAAAMLRSGDWLVPRLNGIEHFEKPPLSMWAMAGSMWVFGESEGALRIPGVLAALGALVAAFGMAGGTRRRSSVWAVVFALASPLFFAMARVVTTDIYLAGCAALTLFFLVRSVEATGERCCARNLDRAALVSGLGFLVKGPVIWILTLLPAILESFWSQREGGVRRLFAPRRLLLFSCVALPWFLAVGMREPGLLRWFLEKRTVTVLTSSKGFHERPFYFFVPVFLLGLLPASFVLLGAGRAGLRALTRDPRGRLLFLAMTVPLLVFSLSASKLATYLVPVVVPTAVLAADLLGVGLAWRGMRGAALALGGLALAGVGAGFGTGWFEEIGPAATAWLVAAGVVLLLGVTAYFLLERGGPSRAGPLRRAGVLLGAQVAMSLVALPAAPLAEAHLTRVGVGRDLAEVLAAYGADGRPLVCYRCFIRCIPFYTGRNTLTLGWYQRGELAEDAWCRVALDDAAALSQLARDGQVAVLCKMKRVNELREAVPELVPVRAVGRFAILEARQPEVLDPGLTGFHSGGDIGRDAPGDALEREPGR